MENSISCSILCSLKFCISALDSYLLPGKIGICCETSMVLKKLSQALKVPRDKKVWTTWSHFLSKNVHFSFHDA